MSEQREWLIDDAIAHAEAMPERRDFFGICSKCHQRGVVEVSVSSRLSDEAFAQFIEQPNPTSYGRILRYCRKCRTILHDTGGTPRA